MSTTLALLLLGGLIAPGSLDAAAAAPQTRVSEEEPPSWEESPAPETPAPESPAPETPVTEVPNAEVPTPDAPPAVGEDLGTQPVEENSEPSAEGAEAAASANLAAQAAALVLAAGEARITVKTGGTRAIVQTRTRPVNGLAGVELKLYNPQIENGNLLPKADMDSPVNEPWATCVSDANGDCNFIVPDTQVGGMNRDKPMIVVQTGAPDGWYMNSVLKIGTPQDASDRVYQFKTNDRLRSGNTYTSGANFMMHTQGAGFTISTGQWQSSLANPEFVCRVGLRVALVLDLSNSVRDDVTTLKSAAKGYVSALEDTGSSVALYTFASNAPSASGKDGKNYPSRPIDSNLEQIHADIDAYKITSGSAGATNWDAGIYQVAKSAEQYDTVIMITDGMPTYYNFADQLRGGGVNTVVAGVESAIFSANTLKAKVDANILDHTGTRLLVVGVGTAINSDPANLAAVSGVTAYDTAADNAVDADYFQVDWQQLETVLKDIAETAICSANVKIVKMTQRDGTDEPVLAGAGWDFGFATTAGAAWSDPAAAGQLAQNRSTDVNGTTEDILLFESSLSDAVTVSLDELMKQAQIDARWSLQSKSCVINGAPATPLSSSATGLQLTVGVADKVVCTFENVQLPSLGLKLVKSGWATDDAAKVSDRDAMDPAVEEIIRGTIHPFGSVVTWTYDVTNQGLTEIRDISLVDDRLAAVTCPATVLAPGATMRCTGTGPLFDTSPAPSSFAFTH